MALTFPRTLPLTKFLEVTFTPVRRSTMGAVESGADVAIDRGAPAWKVKWTTNPLSPYEFGVWRAFFASLRGPQRYFLGWDSLREYPYSYMPSGGLAWPSTRAGGGSWDGSATLTAIGNATAARDLITLGTLPASFSMGPSDYVAFAQGGQWSLHTVIEASTLTANSSGLLALQVEPELPAFITTAAVAYVYRAQAKFRLTSTPDMAANADNGPRPGSVTFEAISTLR